MSFVDRTKSALDMISSVAVIGAVAILSWVLFFKQPVRSAAQEPTVVPLSGLHLDAARLTNVTGRGSIVIVEFSDFQCPFCAKYAQETLPLVKRDLIEKGRVKYAALQYPLENIHPLALEASEASECAARHGRFWEMHDQLFRNPTSLDHTSLMTQARAIGVDATTFEGCLTSHDTLAKIRADQAEGKRLGVEGTPSFLIGLVRVDGGIDLRKRIGGAVPFEVFVKEVGELESQSSLRVSSRLR